MESFFAKMKWILLALFAGIGAFLAILYGKKTPQVLKTKLKEVQAREKVLHLELKNAELEANRKNGKLDAGKHLKKVEAIDRKLVDLAARRERVISESKDLPYVSDDDVAASDNARARTRGSR